MKKLYFIILLSCLITTAQENDHEQSTLIKIGQEIPSLTFKDNSNIELNLQNYKGKVVLINFFCYLVWSLFSRNSASSKRNLVKLQR